MADLSTMDKEILEKLFKMREGYVLDFTDRTFSEFFENELGVDIFDEKYNYYSGSKANRMRAFWKEESNEIVGKCILKLIEYIQTKVELGDFKREDYPQRLIEKAVKIANKLSGDGLEALSPIMKSSTETSYNDGIIAIKLNDSIFSHVKDLLATGHYFSAVEESFKIVRNKLKEKTGSERATDAFRQENFEKIFGRTPQNDVERDFFQGVKFLHMAIQFFRNEKAHTPAYEIDKNLALHYIVLASLAFDLINRGEENE